MEESPQPLRDFIAGRLLAKAEEQLKDEEKKAEETPLTAPLAVADFIPANPFIKVEKNLASLGFFTPSSKRIKDLKEKTIAYRKEIDGKKIEVKATIVPSAKYGLPITADQDKYLALQRIVTDIYKATGKVSNPVSFSSAELLKSLGLADAGKNFHEVGEWLNLMYSTTIISEGVVYFAGKKKWVTDRFRVFDRAVSVGGELEPGVTAEKNYVWFSDWQLENINNNHLLPIDHETYNQLKNHITKILVPLLQIWLYATRDEGSFEKRYEELA